MSDDLKERILKGFPGKMENQQAFIMQFVMEEAQKGNPPPPRDVLEKTIDEMVSEGTFEKKGGLLILKVERASPVMMEEEEDIPVTEITGDFTELQMMILKGFQGKFENRTALVMNAIMSAAQKGEAPPAKEELEKSIDELIGNGTLEVKGNMLIKKI